MSGSIVELNTPGPVDFLSLESQKKLTWGYKYKAKAELLTSTRYL